jgi:hypothetical protein
VLPLLCIQPLYLSHNIESNSTLLRTVFRTTGFPFSGNGDVCVDEELKDNKKGKVMMMLEKVMLDKEREILVVAVGRH